MARIVGLPPSVGVATGGSNVTFRHVEALVALGYDATLRLLGAASSPPPTPWSAP